MPDHNQWPAEFAIEVPGRVLPLSRRDPIEMSAFGLRALQCIDGGNGQQNHFSRTRTAFSGESSLSEFVNTIQRSRHRHAVSRVLNFLFEPSLATL